MRKIAPLLVISLQLIFIFSCRKDSLDTSSSVNLNFSTDTLLFDTVFATFGSTTKRLKIYNPSSNPVIISSIAIENGANSQFRINVDGTSGNIHKEVLIDAKDSLFIFAEVTIDPTNALNPFIAADKILFTTNGNNQSVELVAWGRNAHYYVANQTANGIPVVYLDKGTSPGALDHTWTNDKPYIIYGGYLTLDSDDKLTIGPGVQIHAHNNSGVWVYENGTIRVNGTKEEPVVFQGTRLEYAWQDVPGQWDRIWINENTNGVDNVFNYAVIKNGFIGIQAETNPFNILSPVSANKLRLNNCKIHNNSAVGLLTTNYQITDTNSTITNSGQYNLLIKGDGAYNFNHTTFANYWTGGDRKTPSILIQNAYTNIEENTVVSDLTAANFNNCIIHGDQEIEFSAEQITGGTLNFFLNHCILKTTSNISSPNYNEIELNPEGDLFVDKILHDYHLSPTSAAINKGDNTLGITTDHDGNDRSDGEPDIGAYEL
jgi:hypothetical protein